MIVINGLAALGATYVVLTYLVDKLFPQAENVSSTDPRYIHRYGSTTDSTPMA